MNKRQQSMQRRRELVLEAARTLLATTGSAEFRMADLADRAGVSVQTIYNMFGSKSGVLFALLNEIVDLVDNFVFDLSGDDPVDNLLGAIDYISSIYLDEPATCIPLLRFLFGVEDQVHRSVYIEKCRTFWENSFDLIYRMTDGIDVPKKAVSEDMLCFVTGVLEAWIQGDIDDAGFRQILRRGGALRLLALDLPGVRVRLMRELALD